MFLLVPAHPGCPGLIQGAVKWLCVCVWYCERSCILQEWNSHVVLLIYKWNGDPMECESNRGIKLLNHAMNFVKGSLNTQFVSRLK